jgi:hypothetical protein
MGIRKVYGPYMRKDGRKHVIIRYEDDTRRTVSYPRYLKECELGVALPANVHVHHVNKDYQDDSLSNLEVKDGIKHIRDHQVKYPESATFTCYWCGKRFEVTRIQQRDRGCSKRRGNVGPFCSKSCIGSYGRARQLEQLDRDIYAECA